MPKFAVLSSAEFRSPMANAARVTRWHASELLYVVTCEADDGSWCELDATSLQHARNLSRSMVEKMKARGCSVWGFNPKTGKLRKRASFTYYWSGYGPTDGYRREG